jgi:broad specificity phosphatase PhoE
MPVIYLIRHVQASFGDASYDVLSELGHRQAELLDESLARRGVRAARVEAGTPARQQDTARACPRSAPGELRIDPRWDEYDTAAVLVEHGADRPGEGQRGELGAPAGISSREFQALLDRALGEWIRADESSPCPETWPAFQERALAALEDLARALGSGEQAAVFTSGGVIAALCVGLLGAPPEVFVTVNRVAVNSGVTKVMVGGSGARLVTFNEHAHLEHDRALMTFR